MVNIMDNVDELLSKKRKYKNLKSNINLIISKLNSSIENLEVPSNEIKKIYNVDSISIDEGALNSVREKLTNKKNYLRNNILYAINKELNKVEQEIESEG